MISDDYTGVLASGVKFSEMGIDTAVYAHGSAAFDADPAEVLVPSVSTRHLPARLARWSATSLSGPFCLDSVHLKADRFCAAEETLERKIAPDELHFSSSRGGAIPGTHMILFDSAVDTIEIKHTARGREDFAAGAIMAAEFIQAKTGFYTIDDLMEGIIGGVTQH